MLGRAAGVAALTLGLLAFGLTVAPLLSPHGVSASAGRQDGVIAPVLAAPASIAHPLDLTGRSTMAAAAIQPVLDEGAPAVRQLHNSVVGGAEPRALAAESKVRSVFSASLREASSLDVTCTASRCEVHGIYSGDDVAARLALRDDRFLDSLEKAGWTTGTDLVVTRDNRTEFVVYLDPQG